MKNLEGKLIVLDSKSDACGKETQTELLYNNLLKLGYKVKKISFPNYDSQSSGLLKMYLNGDFGTNPEDVPPKIASTFYALDRYASYRTDWGKYLNDGYVVITDRYTTSNMIHQGGKISNEDEREEYLEWLYDYEYNFLQLPKPDKVIILNLPIEISESLIKNRANKINNSNKKDIHESNSEYLRKCYNNAKDIADKYGWEQIDCAVDGKMKSREEISKEILKSLNL